MICETVPRSRPLLPLLRTVLWTQCALSSLPDPRTRPICMRQEPHVCLWTECFECSPAGRVSPAHRYWDPPSSSSEL